MECIVETMCAIVRERQPLEYTDQRGYKNDLDFLKCWLKPFTYRVVLIEYSKLLSGLSCRFSQATQVQLDECCREILEGGILTLEQVWTKAASQRNVRAINALASGGRVVFVDALLRWVREDRLYQADYQIQTSLDHYCDGVSCEESLNLAMENYMARIIQGEWKKCITTPSHPACKRRLMREYDEMRSTE